MFTLLDHRFDELAADAHENLAPRAAVAVGACAVSAMLLPWRVCVAWLVFGLSVEACSWFASRAQFLRRPVTRRVQVAYLATLLALIANWFLLALLFWHSHTVEGGLSAVIIWLSIIGFAQTFASRSPLGFTASGILPALGAFAVVLTDPLYAGMRWGPIVGILLLALAFAVAGARQTFAAGRRLDETQAQLRDSEMQYRTLADHITDVVGRNALDGDWRYISPSVEAAMGYTPDEVRALPSMSYVHPDDQPAMRAGIADLLANRSECTVEYRLFRKDGSISWMETSFSAVYDPATGEPCELVTMSRDINRRKAMEQDLIEALHRAEAAAAAKADFLANMTHELRTPLNAIIGFSGVLQGSQSVADRDRRHARLIHDASETLLVVVNSVLDFSKLEAGGFELEDRPFDPLAMVRSVASLVEDQARARGLTLEIRTTGATHALSGDGPRLRQVVLNLLSNALKFTATGGVEVVVEQSSAGAGAQRLRVAVSDTGIGIAADQLDAVFERFNQADSSVSRRFGGTGLGLAICKRIVELMGGEVGVASREGEGSTFWFEVTLPIAAAGAHVQSVETGPTRMERPLRLLLVEDVDVNRELVRTILADFDIDIDEAANGSEAVEAMGRSDYDVVLMDVQMPVMDGLTATRTIRGMAAPAAGQVPILAMTANVLPHQVQRCLEAGMDGHLGKPIDPRRLVETLAAWTAGPEQVAQLRATGS